MIVAIVPSIFSRGSMAGMQTQEGRADSHPHLCGFIWLSHRRLLVELMIDAAVSSLETGAVPQITETVVLDGSESK